MIELDRWCGPGPAPPGRDHRAYRGYQFHLIYQKVHNFCVVDLGGFYLDVIKDRQYTTQADGLPRRSARPRFTTWPGHGALARPRHSFTADEIWGHMPAPG